ncbi:LOW QUALITY PROTEIN: hypothetical protein HZS_5300 [Henneguya salminicola]|nr:LOW QUALITY PROTEIN: hypothetical protein HZS_5300 [Henneguya salminicola]
MIWATSETLALLSYNSHVFIDAPFRSTPKDFSHCLATMTLDLGTQTFVSCAYTLMTGKLEYLYSVVLHEMIFLSELKWMPKYITPPYFEKGLINAIKYEFSKISTKKKKVPQNIETILELLNLVKHRDISNAFEYIEKKIVEDLNVEKTLDLFRKDVDKKYSPVLWNVKNIFNDDAFAGRTNNSVDQYPRRLSANLANSHPHLAAFVEVIRMEFKFHEEQITEIRRNGTRTL